MYYDAANGSFQHELLSFLLLPPTTVTVVTEDFFFDESLAQLKHFYGTISVLQIAPLLPIDGMLFQAFRPFALC